MIVAEKVYIPSPSDFTIEINSLLDENGNQVDLNNNYVRFLFYDNTGASYECIHDPLDDFSRNTSYSDGVVSLYIENYHLKSGELRYRIQIKSIDDNYPDGKNSVFTSLRLSGIVLV